MNRNKKLNENCMKSDLHTISDKNSFFQFIFITPGHAECDVDKLKMIVLSGLRWSYLKNDKHKTVCGILSAYKCF